MNKEEEQAANENHTSQSDMNEKVLTQNGCSTPKIPIGILLQAAPANWFIVGLNIILALLKFPKMLLHVCTLA